MLASAGARKAGAASASVESLKALAFRLRILGTDAFPTSVSGLPSSPSTQPSSPCGFPGWDDCVRHRDADGLIHMGISRGSSGRQSPWTAPAFRLTPLLAHPLGSHPRHPPTLPHHGGAASRSISSTPSYRCESSNATGDKRTGASSPASSRPSHARVGSGGGSSSDLSSHGTDRQAQAALGAAVPPHTSSPPDPRVASRASGSGLEHSTNQEAPASYSKPAAAAAAGTHGPAAPPGIGTSCTAKEAASSLPQLTASRQQQPPSSPLPAVPHAGPNSSSPSSLLPSPQPPPSLPPDAPHPSSTPSSAPTPSSSVSASASSAAASPLAAAAARAKQAAVPAAAAAMAAAAAASAALRTRLAAVQSSSAAIAATDAVHSGMDAVQGALGRAGSNLLARATELGAKLNEVTGYAVIEQLKVKVGDADAGLARSREAQRASKAAYEAHMVEHSEVQRQLMSLLQRKGSWGGADVESFTQLCHQEHRLEGGVAQAKAAYGAASEALEAAHGELLRAIRERYSAETLWSDKIRRASTWWTAGLMALHLVSFLSVYLVMEPVKARRLRSHVEEVLRVELANVRQTIASLQTTLESHVAGTTFEQAQAAAMAAQAATVAGGLAVGGDGEAEAESSQRPLSASDVDILPELRRVRQQLAEVEAVVAELGGGLAAQMAAVKTLTETVREAAAGAAPAVAAAAPVASLPGQGRRQGPPLQQGATVLGTPYRGLGEGGEGLSEDEGGDVREGGREVGQVRKRLVEWGYWAGEQLRRAAAIPEVRTGAAAFAGAVLGAGVLVLLHDRR